MLELVIIADDLTGALDAAALFAMRGIRTEAALDLEGISQALTVAPRVLSISTDSREISAEQAAQRVGDVLSALPSGVTIFKKVDSRLKGNIAAELAAIPHNHSLVAPAIPAFDRLVRNGSVCGFGVAEPISVAAALGDAASFATIPDTVTQNDIARSLDGAYDLFVGARGLAEALAERMSGSTRELVSANRRPAFIVIGSTDPITLKQVEYLRGKHPEIAYIPAPNGQISATGPKASDVTIIQATSGENSADGKAVSQALAESLNTLAAPENALLILSGGATAQTILEHRGIHTLQVYGEALPGLPISGRDGLTVISKSGGFGAEDTLIRLLTPAVLGAR